MNSIYNNSTSINLLNNNNSKNVTLVNNKLIINENLNNSTITQTATNTDSIQITEKDENKINTKKANDALNEACSEFNGKIDIKAKVEFFMIKGIMELNGIDVPSFDPDDSTNGNISFLKFIDKMKDFVNKNNITDRAGNPMDKTGFLGFCDLYKEKLNQYGCE